MDNKEFKWTCIILILLITGSCVSQMARGATSSKFKLPERFEGGDVSIVVDRFELIKKYNPVDLGQGSPDFLPPAFVDSALLNVTSSKDPSVNQYAAYYGHPKLLRAIARLYSNLINRDLDPGKNVIVTLGATEALYATLQAHTFPGDEWIVIEPAYDLYASIVRMAGGIPKFVQLRPTKTRGKISSSDWVYDKQEMTRAFNRRTMGILINTPHNPTGKVFTKEELQFIAALAIKWNTLVLTDEVYEWLIYKPNKHIRMATLPDMYERTITVSSASKTFSVTGWRIGWAYGPSNLLFNLKAVHPKIVCTIPTPQQIAIANAMDIMQENLDLPNSYPANYVKELHSKRNYVVNLLEEIGMSPIVPQSGYYVTANWTALAWKVNLQNDTADELRDVKFITRLVKNVGVLGVPVSSFYSKGNKNLGESYIRFCFIKITKELSSGDRILNFCGNSFIELPQIVNSLKTQLWKKQQSY